VRVVSAANFGIGANLRISFDNFNNPPRNIHVLLPINLRINYIDGSNSAVTSYSTRTSYFPNIYYSDSVNLGVPAAMSSNNVVSGNNQRGATNVVHYWTINSWPFSSSSSDVSQKISFKLQGGYTCCQNHDLLRFSDNTVYYTRLWVNNAANTSVYVMPDRGQGNSANFHINAIRNPEQVNRHTYDKIRTATAILYNNYKAVSFSTVNQPSFSSYSANTDFTVKSDLGTAIDKPTYVHTHLNYPLTYDFHWTPSSNSYANRNISYIIVYFTGGVRLVEEASLRYPPSPNYINKVGYVKHGYDTSVNRWYLNISGIMNSITTANEKWYARVRLYADSTNISYTSQIFNFNGF